MDLRVAAYAVIIDGDSILLAHWREGRRSSWTLPGGGIDPGEDPADAAVREIFEETGYTARLDRLLGVDSVVIPDEQRFAPNTGPLHALRIIYSATVLDGTLRNEIGGSTDKAEWTTLSRVASRKTVSLVEKGIRLHREAQPDS